MQHLKKESSGFALLLTLIVVSVVISIGLTLIDLTIKQLRLSTGSKDSESAFHAANAGVECARYWRLEAVDEFEDGSVVAVECFDEAPVNTSVTNLGGSDDIFKYEFSITWGSAGATERCSKVTMITLSSDPASAGVTLANVPSHIPGYPNNNNKTCAPGGRCTIISSQGYNQPCSAVGQIGTIQREVLLEL